jgi:hypothetical protein
LFTALDSYKITRVTRTYGGGVVFLTELTREKRIKKEVIRLKRLFNVIPKNTLESVLSLITNAAFMAITLEDLQQKINEDGAVTKYQNGENQWGTKKSPEVEIYNTMVKNHASLIKQLTELIPKPDDIPIVPVMPPPKKQDAFERIVNRGQGG